MIHAPSDLAAKLDVSAGEAQVQGRFRSLEAGIGAGKLTSDFVQCKGDVVLHVGAGEVDAKIPAGANTDVKADVAMGEITGLPSGAKRESGLHFGDHRHGKTGQGDSKLNIHVGAGSIKVESRDRILASTNVDTEQAADDESIEIIENRDDYGIGKSVDASVRAALAATRDALRNTNIDTKIELGDLKIDDLGDLKGLDADLAKELAKIGPEIERAMKTAQPEIEKAMKSIGPEIERAMKDAKPDFDRAMKAMHPEIEKAIKMAKLEIAKAMKSVKPEVDRALREALKEIEKAEKELKSHRND